MKISSTRQLVYLSFLICLDIVLTRFASVRLSIGGVEGIRLGFGALPIILAGLLFGPSAGAIVGGMGDILGYFISPIGGYMPHFTCTAALTGLLPALILGQKRTKGYSTWHLLFSIAMGQIISSVLLVPYFLQILFKIPIAVTIPSRIIGQAILIPVYSMLTAIIVRKLQWGFVENDLKAN